MCFVAALAPASLCRTEQGHVRGKHQIQQVHRIPRDSTITSADIQLNGNAFYLLWLCRVLLAESIQTRSEFDGMRDASRELPRPNRPAACQRFEVASAWQLPSSSGVFA